MNVLQHTRNDGAKSVYQAKSTGPLLQRHSLKAPEVSLADSGSSANPLFCRCRLMTANAAVLIWFLVWTILAVKYMTKMMKLCPGNTKEHHQDGF